MKKENITKSTITKKYNINTQYVKANERKI